jgi:hypothetical protein
VKEAEMTAGRFDWSRREQWEARWLIRGGGARLNDAAISDEARLITVADPQGVTQRRLARIGD